LRVYGLKNSGANHAIRQVQMLIMLARQRGAIRVIVSDPIAYCRRHVLEVGVDVALDPLEVLLLDQVYAYL
jgi:threonine dehydrogenase-like Zn-dependent dehydrogenase